MEHLSNQTCERLCLTLPLLKTHSSYNFCVFLHIQGVIKTFFLCTQQKAGSHRPRAEQEVEEDVEREEEEQEGDDHGQHECPLVQQKVNEYPRLPISYNQLFLCPSQPILVQIVVAIGLCVGT